MSKKVEDEEKKSQAAPPPPDLLYSDKDLQSILDRYEEERRQALEELKASKNLPARLPEQSASEYLNANREWLKNNNPKTFEKIGEINKAEHVAMHAGGSYKSILFNRDNPAPLEIKDSNGNKLHELTYRADGNLVMAAVPKNIPKGPMHLSLALQDANGDNIESNKAVFFDISYGPDGKVKSMNYPEPLEFEGDRCKLNIDGKPYYLKVDKATLDSLHQEISRGINRAQDVAVAGLESPEASPAIAPIAPQQPTPVAPNTPKLKPVKLGNKANELKGPSFAKTLEGAKEGLNKTGRIDEKGNFVKQGAPTPPAAPPQGKPPTKPHAAPAVPTTPPNKAPTSALKPIKLSSKGSDGKDSASLDLLAVRAALKPTGQVLNEHGNFVSNGDASPSQQLSASPKAAQLTPPVAHPQAVSLDPEMPLADLNNAAAKLAAATGDLFKTKKQDKENASEDKPKSPDNKMVIKTPSPALIGSGGSKSQFKDSTTPNDSSHNQFSVPPGGFTNTTPEWQKNLAQKNAVARSLRDSSPAIDPPPPIAPRNTPPPGGELSKQKAEGRGAA